MPYIQPADRNQMMMCSLDSLVDAESIIRVIDAFVNALDLGELGFNKTTAAYEGRPAYDPRALLKLYLYGNHESIRSSRKLAKACEVNLEAKWIMGGLEPDFRTISDFRKDNVACLKKVFHEFNHRLAAVLIKGYKSIDGSKFQANNSKDNNFTSNKLDDRIKWLNQHSDEYLRQIAELDEAENEEEMSGQLTREELEEKLHETTERLERYTAYKQYMEKNGLSQISLTDHDSKLMKSKNGFMVAYNIQTAVDSETHLIDNYELTNAVTDHGQLAPTAEVLREKNPNETLEVVADKGYKSDEDMIKCLENGVIPHVILADGQNVHELEIPYEAAECDEAVINSKRSEDLKKCLHAGVIPEAYKEVIDSAQVTLRRKFISEEVQEEKTPYGTEEEMKERAAAGYFVRDPERNIVYCPAGETLRQKCIKKNGNIRYANKSACKHCKCRNLCYKGKNEWKEIDFNKDTLEKSNTNWLKADQQPKPKREHKKGHYEKVVMVRLMLRPDRQKMSQRLCLSEHPFGTIKRAMNAGYFLLNGMKKVDGEVALMCLAYNIKRARNLLGFRRMMEVMA